MRCSAGPVSLIVPCRNAEATLAEALESVFAQTVPPLEVLVIDDASRDGSVRVARSFGAAVRVLRNPARGPGAARRLGVDQARGEFIAYVDADDRIESAKLERQLAAFEAHGRETLVHTASTKFGPGGDTSLPDAAGAEATGDCTEVVFARNPVCGASTMLRREVIVELGNYDADMVGAEDFLMSLVASTRCRFVHIAEPLYRRRRHASNLTCRRSLMAYHHWLAQERFRQRCPAAFAKLPAELVHAAMVEPVLRAAREAYWQRDGRDYHRLLRLAVMLAPEDETLRQIWHCRWCPMRVLRWWDRWTERRGLAAREVSS